MEKHGEEEICASGITTMSASSDGTEPLSMSPLSLPTVKCHMKSGGGSSSSSSSSLISSPDENRKIRFMALQILSGKGDDALIENQETQGCSQVIEENASLSQGTQRLHLPDGVGRREEDNKENTPDEVVMMAVKEVVDDGGEEVLGIAGNHGKGDSANKHDCICGKEFTSHSGLYIHIVKSTQQAKFPCSSCSKHFHFLSSLKRHTLAVHKSVVWDGDQQLIGCSRCGKSFASRMEKKGHKDSKNEYCKKSKSVEELGDDEPLEQITENKMNERSSIITASGTSVQQSMAKTGKIASMSPPEAEIVQQSSASQMSYSLVRQPSVLTEANIYNQPAASASFRELPRACLVQRNTGSTLQFKKSDRDRSTNSHFLLLKSILRENQQLKQDFDNYKTSAGAQLQQQNDEIQSLKVKVNEYKQKAFEFRLHKKVCQAGRDRILQKIEDSLESLREKVAQARQTHAFKLGRVNLNAEELRPNNMGASFVSSKDTEDLGWRLEGDMSTASFRGGDIQTIMEDSNRKLAEILTYLKEFFLHSSGGAVDTTHIQTMADLHSNDNATEEDVTVQELYEHTKNVDNIIGDIDHGIVNDAANSTNASENERNIKEIVIKMSDHSRRAETRASNRSKRSGMSPSNKRKRIRQDTQQIENEDRPPQLSLPPRIVKNVHRRPQSMPILLPEIKSLGERNHRDSSERRNLMNVNLIESNKLEQSVQKKLDTGTGKTHGRDDSQPGFVCLCGSKFTGAGGLYVHQVKCTESEKFSCSVCGKRFHYFSGLKAHRKSTHKLKFTPEVGCSRCGRVFSCKAQRQGHLDAWGQTCWLSGSYQNKEGKKLQKRAVIAVDT